MEYQNGYKGVNKQGLSYEVIDYVKAKKITIRFDLDGATVTTTKFYLSEGLPAHPTYGKLLEGCIFKDRAGNEFELVERVKYATWKIRYLKDGVECIRENKRIKAGTGRHPTDGVLQVGQRYKTRSGEIEVLQIDSHNKVLVRFEDGVLTTANSAAIKKGNVGHPTSGIIIGQKLMTNSGWEYEPIEYISPCEVVVKMEDGSIETHTASAVKSGSFKPMNQPSVSGVGYIGIGRFTSGSKNEGENAPEEILSYWRRMIARCYNPEEINKNSGRRYLFTEIHKDWFNFQNFAEWALTQPNWNKGFDLDKDLLNTNGYPEYKAENCCFLPPEVNVFLAENWSKDTHNLPIGIQYIKPGTKGAKEGYVARCHRGKGREYLGYFDDPMDAYRAYKSAKEGYARVLAERYKDVITPEAYNRLLTFEITKVYHDPIHECSNQ